MNQDSSSVSTTDHLSLAGARRRVVQAAKAKRQADLTFAGLGEQEDGIKNLASYTLLYAKWSATRKEFVEAVDSLVALEAATGGQHQCGQ